MPHSRVYRIAFTGAPFAGKTETWKAIGDIDSILRIRETADSLYDCGFPRPADVLMDYEPWMFALRHLFVPARLAMQIALEDALDLQAQRLGKRAVVCDRTVLDGVLYYKSLDEFLLDAKINVSEALLRYDMVVFFETRILERDIDEYDRRMPPLLTRQAHFKLKKVWEYHPGFRYVPVFDSLEKKVEAVRACLGEIL